MQKKCKGYVQKAYVVYINMNLHKKEKSVFLLEMLDDLIGQVVWKMYGCMDKN